MLVRPLDQPWPRMGAPADCFCWKGKSQVQCLWQSSAQSRCYLMSSGTVQKSAFRLRTLHKQDVIAICQETQLFFRTRLSSGSTVTFSLFFFSVQCLWKDNKGKPNPPSCSSPFDNALTRCRNQPPILMCIRVKKSKGFPTR